MYSNNRRNNRYNGRKGYRRSYDRRSPSYDEYDDHRDRNYDRYRNEYPQNRYRHDYNRPDDGYQRNYDSRQGYGNDTVSIHERRDYHDNSLSSYTNHTINHNTSPQVSDKKPVRKNIGKKPIMKSKMNFQTKAVSRRAKLGHIKLKRSPLEADDDDNDEDAKPLKKKLKIRVKKPVKKVNLDLFLKDLEQEEQKTNKAFILDENSEEVAQKPKNTLYVVNKPTETRKSTEKLPVHESSQRKVVKNLYRESDFISKLKDDEVESLRLKDCISVHGKRARKPILDWSQLGLPSVISTVMKSMNFKAPTPIQCEALPNIMSGNDFIGVAKTGSGKTLAYLLPLFRHISVNEYTEANREHGFSGSKPTAIVITPTRELAIQVFEVCEPFLKSLHMEGACCYGGQPITNQIAMLKKQCDLIVATPGRLFDLLCANGGRVLSLSEISYFVLDEADRMFDMGFEPQVSKISRLVRRDRQAVLFSATFPPKVEKLARSFLHSPIRVSVGTRNLLSKDIEQEFQVLEGKNKFSSLLRILGQFKSEDKTGKVLIFADTQNSCNALVDWLAKRGYVSLCLHGGRDQADRDAILKDFQDGVVDILVATSVASRGLDIENLNLVVNYDSPTHMEDYIHRVGRTGRAGRKGKSVTFIMPSEEKSASDIVHLLELSKMPVPSDLQNMANSFREKIKQGKAKFSGGFGGNGLEKLQSIREEKKRQQERIVGDDKGDKGEDEDKKDKKKDKSKSNGNETSTEVKQTLDVKLHASSATDSSLPFHADVQVNDLPSKIRWAVSNSKIIKSIIDQTGVAFTNKGQYYPAGKNPGPNDPPKLYLLVEGDTELHIKEAVNMLNVAYSEALANV